MARTEESASIPFFAKPTVGTVFTVLSGLSFYFLMMVLPLVGPAAAHGSGSPGAYRAPQYATNFRAFLALAIVSLALGILAVVSKMERRKIDGSPLPLYSIGLSVACVLLLVALFTGMLGW